MISNFHQSSGPYESSSYFTFDEPSPATPASKTKKTKKKKGRIFGLGKPKKAKSTELGDWRPPQHVDDQSTITGQSLTYSTSAASYQTTGESTDSSGGASSAGAFGEILKLLDEEDRREMLEKRKQFQSDAASTSSLAYSEGGTTLNYSEDGDQSFLHGTKLLGMLHEPEEASQPRMYTGTKNTGNSGRRPQVTPEQPHVMTPPSPSPQKTPVVDNKSQTRARRTRDHSLRPERKAMVVEDEDPVSSSSSNNRWLCGMDLGDAGAALRPFLCF